jgi:hypothetical protein
MTKKSGSENENSVRLPFLGRMSGDSSDGSRGPRPLSLSNLASNVMRVIQSNPVTTFQDAADLVVEELRAAHSGHNDEKNTKRRVYDVLNVLLASGLIVRDGRSIRFRPLGTPPPIGEIPEADRAFAQSCERKQAQVVEKIKLLLSYRTLMSRNASQTRPTTAVALPTIVVGFNSNIEGDSNTSLDHKTLQIHASANPLFYSPMDVFRSIHLSVEAQREELRQIPALASMESYVFSDND